MPRPPIASDQFGRAHWAALAFATVVAAALRLLHLGEWSLWIDEAHTWRDANMPLAGPAGYLHSDRVFYPIAPLLLRVIGRLGWTALDEASMRLPFALLGIATVPLLASCGRRLVGPWPAVLAAWLLAVNPWHVFWSQNVRGYVLVMLATVVAANRAHAWLQSDRPFDLIAAAAAVGLGCLSHPSAGLIVAGFAAFLVLRHTSSAPSSLRVLGFAALLSVLLVGVPWWLREYSPFQDFLRSKDDPSVVHFVQTTAYYFRPTLLLLGALALLTAGPRLGRDRTLLLGCLWLAPFVALAAVSAQLAKVTARYAICTLPVLTWLAALAAAEIARIVAAGGPAVLTRSGRLAVAAVLPLFAFGDFAQLDVKYYGVQHGQRARWREAAEFVRQRAGGRGVQVLTINEPTMLYYLRPEHWSKDGNQHPGIEVVVLLRWSIDDERKEAVAAGISPAEAYLQKQRKRAETDRALLALVVTQPELVEIDSDGAFAAVLARDFELAQYLPCWVGPKDESVYVYLPRP